MNEEKLTKYYNKFNEDKRLKTRHAQVEYLTALNYIIQYLDEFDHPKLLDVGAGCGAYSIPLHQEGFDVTSIELVKHNLMTMKAKDETLKAYQGNAIDLSRFNDESFDVVLLFGPMYHLISEEDKIKALNEAKRVCKNNGYILISYCMNEYAIIEHGFRNNNIVNAVNNNHVDDMFHILESGNELYSYMRLEDINRLNEICQLKREKCISQDSFAEYMKNEINNMDDESFHHLLNYHFNICERSELLGMSRHILDILKK